MKSKFVNSKKDLEEMQWNYPKAQPNRKEKRMIVARVAEIGTRVVFENFSYQFGEDIFLQSSGGPIGARVTMAAARIVMQSWSRRYKSILLRSGLRLTLLAGYVDDGRHSGTTLRRGMRYVKEKDAFVFSKEWKDEDDALGETSNVRMARVCKDAMNSVSDDLQFTTEAPEDFEQSRLPTLDFKLWLVSGTIMHTYFEKEMRTPFVVMRRSAMGEQQRMAILSNELIRRLSNVGKEVVEAEVFGIIEHYIYQLKMSEYERSQARDIVCSGVIGWKRKIQRREKEQQGFYRHGKSTLKSRNRKKLLEKTTWFRQKRKREDEEDDEMHLPARKMRYSSKMQAKSVKQNGDAAAAKVPDIKAVMFIPYTTGSKLAKSLREAEEKLGSLTGYRLKVVEKAGDKLEDLLTKSNPWQGMDCGRQNCLLCETKLKTDKNLSQDCHTRNLVYETWCMTCLRRDEEDAERRGEGDAGRVRELKRKIRKHLYIGETSRSMYERALEHQGDIDQLKSSSHMLRHMLEMHRGEERSEIEFGVRVMRYTRSSFERQVLESVLIQSNRDHHILNSRSEFNRCAIPRLVAKLGDKELKLWREKDKEREKAEEKIEEEIRMMKKSRNKDRASHQRRDPKSKRQKLDEDAPVEITAARRETEMQEGEKRKIPEQEIVGGTKKKLKRSDIRYFVKNCGEEMSCGDATLSGGATSGPRGTVVCDDRGGDAQNCGGNLKTRDCDDVSEICEKRIVRNHVKDVQGDVEQNCAEMKNCVDDQPSLNCGDDCQHASLIDEADCGDAARPGGARYGPRGAVVCGEEGGDENAASLNCGDEDAIRCRDDQLSSRDDQKSQTESVGIVEMTTRPGVETMKLPRRSGDAEMNLEPSSSTESILTNHNISTSSSSTTPITQSGAILPAVVRYDEFQLDILNVPILTQSNTGLSQAEMQNAETSVHRDDASVPGDEASVPRDEMNGPRGREREGGIVDSSVISSRNMPETERIAEMTARPSVENMMLPGRLGDVEMNLNAVESSSSAESIPTYQDIRSSSSSTTPTTQTGAILPAVARYDEFRLDIKNVPILSMSNTGFIRAEMRNADASVPGCDASVPRDGAILPRDDAGLSGYDTSIDARELNREGRGDVTCMTDANVVQRGADASVMQWGACTSVLQVGANAKKLNKGGADARVMQCGTNTSMLQGGTDARMEKAKRQEKSRMMECSSGQENSNWQEERLWAELRSSKKALQNKNVLWQKIADKEMRKLEKEERGMRQEILKKRKEKFGKISGKKLTVIEEKILKNQTEMLSELAEVGRNVEKEQLRRQGKKLRRLEESLPEGWKNGEGQVGGGMSSGSLDEEGHWERMMAHRTSLLNNKSWMNSERLESSSLEEQRMWAYGWKLSDNGDDIGRGVWKFWEDTTSTEITEKDTEIGNGHEKDALVVQEGWRATSQVEDFILQPRLTKHTVNEMHADNQDYQDNIHAAARKNHAEDNMQAASMLSFREDNIHADKSVIKRDAELLNFSFGRPSSQPQVSEMQEGRQKTESVVDRTPGKIRRGPSEMRATAGERKDASRAPRSKTPCRERSQGAGGRVVKKVRCTPTKIRKISHVSTLKHFFEQCNVSPPTRGAIELLEQPSTQNFILNPGPTTTTTRDASFSRKDCVSQSGSPIQTGPRQTATSGASLSQDWPRHARFEEGEPMGDALTGLGERIVQS